MSQEDVKFFILSNQHKLQRATSITFFFLTPKPSAAVQTIDDYGQYFYVEPLYARATDAWGNVVATFPIKFLLETSLYVFAQNVQPVKFSRVTYKLPLPTDYPKVPTLYPTLDKRFVKVLEDTVRALKTSEDFGN